MVTMTNNLSDAAPTASRGLPGTLRMAILFNPTAGYIHGLQRKLWPLQREFPGRLWIREASLLENMPQYVAQCREFAPDILGIAGGDGTIHQVLNHYLRTTPLEQMPIISFLGGGSQNCVHMSLGREGRLLSALRRLLEIGTPEQLAIREQRLIRVNHDRYGFLVAYAFAGKLLQEFNRRRGDRTREYATKFTWDIIRRAFSPAEHGEEPFVQHWKGRLFVDGVEEEPRRWLHVVAGNIDWLPVWITILNHTPIVPDTFRLSACGVPFEEIGLDFWKVLWGKGLDDPRYLVRSPRHCRFELEEPSPIIVEGELVGVSNVLELEITEQKLRVLRGLQ
jgi:diacylglycerol kinase family enzyme